MNLSAQRMVSTGQLDSHHAPGQFLLQIVAQLERSIDRQRREQSLTDIGCVTRITITVEQWCP